MSASSDAAPAQWFGADGRRVAAEVWFDDRVNARNADGESRSVSHADAVVSPRLGTTPRRIEFPDGVVVSVDDNDFVDAALRRAGQARGSRMMHRLESRTVWAAVLIVAAALAAWLALTRGLPLAGEVAANNISAETLRDLSSETYDALVAQGLLSPSELSPERATRARELFAELASRFADDNVDYRLKIHAMRFGEKDIPNAFAFPDGLIVMTDRLAALADDGELTAVFAHEFAHARERHGARMLAQAAGAAGLAALVVGDFTGAVAAAALSAGYSREFEREADCFAYRVLSDIGTDPRKMGSVLRKMEDDMKIAPPVFSVDEKAGTESETESESNPAEAALIRVIEFWSTHPPTAARENPQEHCK